MLGTTVIVTEEMGAYHVIPYGRTVSDSIEYPAGSFGDNWQIDITDTQFILTKTTASVFPFLKNEFCGFVLTLFSGTIVSASVDPSSDFSPVGISLPFPSELKLDYQGVTAPSDFPVSSIIDINTDVSAVPEPATWITFLASSVGLAGLGLLRVRHGISRLGWR